jgi:hypothetical protein
VKSYLEHQRNQFQNTEIDSCSVEMGVQVSCESIGKTTREIMHESKENQTSKDKNQKVAQMWIESISQKQKTNVVACATRR